MNTDINLLSHKDEGEIKKLRNARRINFVAVLLLAFVGVTSLLIFLFIQIVNPASVQKEQDEILRKITEFKKRDATLFILNDRVDNITQILKNRKDLSKVTDRFLANIPKSLLIDNLEINDKTITLNVSSASLLSIGELMNNLTDMVKKKEIGSLTISSLVFDESRNSYQLSLKSDL